MSVTVNKLPASTPEMRAKAAARSIEERRYRAAEKRRIKAGAVSMSAALSNERLSRMRVRDLARSMPGVGPNRAQDALERMGIDPTRRLGGLGSRQRAALVSWAEESCPAAATAKEGE